MFDGNYFNGRDSRMVRVSCDAMFDGSLAVRGNDVEVSVPRASIRVTPRLARTHRTLYLPGGAQIQSDNNDAVDAAFPDRRAGGIADRLERHPQVVTASVIVTIVALVCAFAFGLPWLADRLAERIPLSVEQRIGEQTLSTLRRVVLKPSKLAAERQAELKQRFATFVQNIPGAEKYQVEFFDAPAIGANAFALPGGTIVFTDALMGMIDNDDEFVAVAAHEVGHERYRHVVRSVLRESAVAIVAAFFAADVSSASTVVVAIPVFLLRNSYSRTFESEADDYAFKELAAHNISPRVFADAMRKFQKEYGEDGAADAYISSHPVTSERIARAEAAADEFDKAKR
jgi:Zn-dependent protease with chaperone function